MLTGPWRVAKRRLGGLAGDASGVSAVEFALVAPVLVLMLGGAVELGGAITAGNRATYVADAIGELVSQTNKTISVVDMEGFIRSAALMDPDIVKYAAQTGTELDQAAKITVSSVQFELKDSSCTSACEYDAFVVFSKALYGAERACTKLTPSSSASSSTLPPDVYSSGSLVVVDVETFYKPLMDTLISGTISFKRSTYFRPRYVPRINYENNCSAYRSS